MNLSSKIKKGIEQHPDIVAALRSKAKGPDWEKFTRTHFNLVARIINKQISREVQHNGDLLELNLVIGKQQLENHLRDLRLVSVDEFTRWLSGMREYQVFNWISGKTLQSYWAGGEAKYVKLNALLVFLRIPYAEWDYWQKEKKRETEDLVSNLSRSPLTANPGKQALSIIRNYYLGNYFLYYQKTDGSRNVIKTPFILKENESGQIVVRSVSEGHRYSGRVMGIRDGCLYINCQNLDFEEMEQYIFNIGLETKPQVLFGVSNTVSVKNRRAVGLKNILVKQQTNDPGFENIQEAEIPFTRPYSASTEEALVVDYLKKAVNNIIITPSCCNLTDLKEGISVV